MSISVIVSRLRGLNEEKPYRIMLALLSAVPSLFTSMDAVMPASRSHILQAILQHNRNNMPEISKRSRESGVVLSRMECCPEETHFIHLHGGISREGTILELYRNSRSVQKFYETTCKPEVKDQPCHFVDEAIQHLSRCVQKYSYVYALVKDYNNLSQSYRLDYIRMKTGCACEIQLRYNASIDLTTEDD